MSSRKQLELAIRGFELQRDKLKTKERELNGRVTVVMRDVGDDVDALQRLADHMPKGFAGTRRIYEKIIRLSPDKEAPPEHS